MPSPTPPADPHDVYAEAARLADAIEREMRSASIWQRTPPPPEALQFKRAFAADTLAFEQWLQFVLLPRVRQIVAERGQFPDRSMVAVQAIREFDGRDELLGLLRLLGEFDGLFRREA